MDNAAFEEQGGILELADVIGVTAHKILVGGIHVEKGMERKILDSNGNSCGTITIE